MLLLLLLLFKPNLAEGLFSSVSTQLVKRSQRMMEKHRQLLFDESVVSEL